MLGRKLVRCRLKLDLPTQQQCKTSTLQDRQGPSTTQPHSVTSPHLTEATSHFILPAPFPPPPRYHKISQSRPPPTPSSSSLRGKPHILLATPLLRPPPLRKRGVETRQEPQTQPIQSRSSLSRHSFPPRTHHHHPEPVVPWHHHALEALVYAACTYVMLRYVNTPMHTRLAASPMRHPAGD